MSEYIDKTEAMRRFMDFGREIPKEQVMAVLASIKEGIVRCRECKYWQPHSQHGYDYDDGAFHDYCGLLVPDDDYYAVRRDASDFCSYGERSEE